MSRIILLIILYFENDKLSVHFTFAKVCMHTMIKLSEKSALQPTLSF